MKRVTFLIIALSMAALLICACSSEEGSVSPKPTESEDNIYGSVSGICKDSGGYGTNYITCYVYDYPAGTPCLSFYPALSEYDPIVGNGFYECDRVPELAPPMDGSGLIVVGYYRGDIWGVSSPFIWTQPDETGIIVNQY